MIDKRKLELFKELFDRSGSILIMCPVEATRDQLFAAASFYATLKVNTQKNVKLLCSEDLSKEKSDIAYLGEAQAEIGHENLCISLDYLEDSIDKVSYHVSEETNKFYLTVKPKKGFAPLSSENVNFSYTGADADMIVLVGVDNLESLGKLYVGYESLFNNTALVSINSYETEFGNLKLDILGTSSFSEFVTQLLKDLQIPIDSEAATNLLAGINEETDGFESFMATADTFEIVSQLMRAGARRISRNTESGSDKKSSSNKNEKEVFQLKKSKIATKKKKKVLKKAKTKSPGARKTRGVSAK